MSSNGDGRRKPPELRKRFEVCEMWEVHHEIVRRLVLGQKAVDIARDLGVSEVMVSYTRNSAVVKEKLALMSGARDAEVVKVSGRIQELAPKAIKILEQVINDETNELAPFHMRVKEANALLDRAGYGAVKSFRTEGIHAHFTAQDIDEIKKRAAEAGARGGTIVDVTPTEVSQSE